MNPPVYQVRRATVDDLAGLRRLWQEAQLPVQELEKRLTEFQVVWDETGELLGAVGLRIVAGHAHLHSEAFRRPELQEGLRPLLWERLHVLAQNHGLARLWTREQAPFWQHYVGFKPAEAAELKELPLVFGDQPGPWFTFKLRDLPAIETSPEKQLELFRQAQQADMERLLHQTQRIKAVLMGVAILFALLLLGLGVLAFVRYRRGRGWRLGR